MKKIVSNILMFSLFLGSAVFAAPAKKKPAPPAAAPAVSAADLNATQGEAPKPAAASKGMSGRVYLEAFGGYGVTYGGILSTPTSGSAAFNGDPRGGLLFAWHWGERSALVASGYYNSKTLGITGTASSSTYKTAFISGALGFRFYSNEHFYGEVGGYYGNPFGDWKIETTTSTTTVNADDRKADIGLYIAGGYLFHLGENVRLNIGMNLQLGITQIGGKLTGNNISAIAGLGYMF